MGRQAYLDKIAFGRSAFEPSQSTALSADYAQLEAPHSDLPSAYTQAIANNYVQLYDDRGNPIHPRSQGYGKTLRDAQNDVLASVGVVARRQSPSENLPGSHGKQLESLETEDTVGNAVALASTVAENACTWWIGSIRERLLTFRYQHATPFVQLVQIEGAMSGTSLLYAGFPCRLFSTMSIQAIVSGTFVYQPISRLLYAFKASSKTRHFFRRWRWTLNSCSRLALEILFYPFSYRSSLERLGLIPATALVPSWDAIISTTGSSSSLLPFSVHHKASASIFDFCKAASLSPVLYVCAEHMLERWIYASIFEAVDSSIIRPDKPRVQGQGRDVGDKDQAIAILGLKKESSPFVRNTINRLLAAIGWAHPSTTQTSTQAQVTSTLTSIDPLIEQATSIGGTQITGLAPLDLPMVQALEHSDSALPHVNAITIPMDTTEEAIQTPTPTTPTAPNFDHEDNDPRIRITSRDGVVEMEVRLPPRILSSTTQVADTFRGLEDGQATPSQRDSSSSVGGSNHRVTQLSSEPAQMIGAMVKAQVVGIAMLPIKMITLRVIAAHYFATQNHGVLHPTRSLFSFNDFSWRGFGVQVSRLALCGTLELSIDLALWSVQYFAITQAGKSLFGWGLL